MFPPHLFVRRLCEPSPAMPFESVFGFPQFPTSAPLPLPASLNHPRHFLDPCWRLFQLSLLLSNSSSSPSLRQSLTPNQRLPCTPRFWRILSCLVGREIFADFSTLPIPRTLPQALRLIQSLVLRFWFWISLPSREFPACIFPAVNVKQKLRNTGQKFNNPNLAACAQVAKSAADVIFHVPKSRTSINTGHYSARKVRLQHSCSAAHGRAEQKV